MKTLQGYYVEILKHAVVIGAGLVGGGLAVHTTYKAAKSGAIKMGMKMMMAKAKNAKPAEGDDLNLAADTDNVND